MTSLVTIGIPSFNSERWLEQAITSALDQRWPEVEVIVVDDGSTDASPEIARKFGGSVRFFSTPHGGANVARNEILRQAKGEWVQFLDADDYLLPEKISRQFDEASLDCEVIYSPVWIEKDGSREASPLDERFDIYSLWISWQLPQTGGCLWRKAALESLGGWNEKTPCCQEHELYMRAIITGLRFSKASTPNGVYRIWSEETLCRRDPRQVIQVRTQLIEVLRVWMESQGLWREEHRALASRACFEMARTWAKYDLAEAGAYHAKQRRQRLILPEGPAAPPAYKLVYRTLGFLMAEKLASALR